jgi:hypothetical protein
MRERGVEMTEWSIDWKRVEEELKGRSQGPPPPPPLSRDVGGVSGGAGQSVYVITEASD